MKMIALVLGLLAAGCASAPYCDGSPPAATCGAGCTPLMVLDGVTCAGPDDCVREDGSPAFAGSDYAPAACTGDGRIVLGIPTGVSPDLYSPVCACD